VALIGVTASGKTELAIGLARARRDAELVSMDSMSVYRGMDIGTAKPSSSQLSQVPFHMFDLVEPSEDFSVSRFQGAASCALAGIEERGNRALLVGGTGLYVRAVVDGLDVPGQWPTISAALDRQASTPGGLETLFRRLSELDPLAATRMEPTNRRRVVRALEVTLGSGRPFSSFGPGLTAYGPTRFVLLGVPYDPASSDARIELRLSSMLEAGLVDEVRRLSVAGMSRTARQALGYKELLAYVEGRSSLEDATGEVLRRTKRFARRQWAWFRRDPRIEWLDPGADYASQILERWDRRCEA